MRSISETAGQELLWVQPAARRREHELRAGDDLFKGRHGFVKAKGVVEVQPAAAGRPDVALLSLLGWYLILLHADDAAVASSAASVAATSG